MTAQDQQSRAEFDVWWKENGLGSYDTQLEAWQAARALPAGAEPVAYLIERSAFRVSPHGQDAESNEWIEEAQSPDDPGAFAVFTAAQVQAMLTHEKASRQAAQQQLEASKADLAKLEMYRFMLAHRGRGDDANTAQTRMDAGSGRGYGLPPGWQAVPVEPTHQMQSAALKYVVRQHQTRDVWRTMLAAAPQTPAAQVLAMGRVPPGFIAAPVDAAARASNGGKS